MTKTLIALPAYNEANVIAKVIRDIKAQGYKEILVVDDCSKDKTSIEAKKEGAKVLRHPINRGAGAATSTAMEYAKRNNYDFIVLMDSDGQHSPKDINKLIKHTKKFDVIIGSRLIGSLKNMPVHRRVANFVGSFLTYLFFGLFVRDSQSGFKVFNKKAINNIKITYDRYEFCSEIIGEIKSNNLSFKEIPIEVIYSDHSQSKGQSIGNGFKMFIRFLLRH